MSAALAEVVEFPERFELHALVTHVLRESDEPNPHHLAELVLEEIPPESLLDALRMTLPDYVRKAIHNQRGQVSHSEQTTTEPRRGRTISPKWEAIASVYAWRYPVAPGEWKLYVDFTADEVLRLVDEYKARAAENTAAADRHAKVVRLMKRRKATTVRDLGEESLKEIFNA